MVLSSVIVFVVTAVVPITLFTVEVAQFTSFEQQNINSVCKPGFNLKNYTENYDFVKLCGKNICTCANGIFATGENCQIDGTEVCESCEAGFNKNANNRTCEINVCGCEHGANAIGEACYRDGGETCVGCDEGFWLDDVGKFEKLFHKLNILWFSRIH